MTNDDDEMRWPPALFAEQFQDASEEAVEQQMKLFQRWLSGAYGANDMTRSVPQVGPFGMGTATFKTRIQSGGRISIPDAEREALDLDEGDIVQAVIIPIKRGNRNE